MLDKAHVDVLEHLVELVKEHGQRHEPIPMETLRGDVPNIDPDHVLRYMRLVDEYYLATRSVCDNLYCEW